MAVSETLVSVGRSVGHQRSSMHAHMACRLFISYLWPFSCELIPHHAYLHACSTQAKIVPLSEGPPSSCAKTVDARCTEDGVPDSSSSEAQKQPQKQHRKDRRHSSLRQMLLDRRTSIGNIVQDLSSAISHALSAINGYRTNEPPIARSAPPDFSPHSSFSVHSPCMPPLKHFTTTRLPPAATNKRTNERTNE
jgi:hypothetical protein